MIRDKKQVLTDQLLALKAELQQIRKLSLEATRKGDFMRVARLTATAAKLNRTIMDTESELLVL